MSSSRSPAGAARSALTLVLLAVSVSLAGFDWIMSLEPLWFSTMFGVHQFAGDVRQRPGRPGRAHRLAETHRHGL